MYVQGAELEYTFHKPAVSMAYAMHVSRTAFLVAIILRRPCTIGVCWYAATIDDALADQALHICHEVRSES